ncbi:dsRBD fold-containing protein [Streptomyces sp. NPDC093097]|uniref:dsRBD fold-containing protein n=1 Tax=Streptomyces sp. NPDC093097 TaxID=3366027 RepID=UPI0037F77B9D
MAKTTEWPVRLILTEEDGTTLARVELDTGIRTLTGHGRARCNPEDTDVPVIGDELAAGRAMKDLAGQLIRLADRDLAGVGAARPGHERRTLYGWADELA